MQWLQGMITVAAGLITILSARASWVFLTKNKLEWFAIFFVTTLISMLITYEFFLVLKSL